MTVKQELLGTMSELMVSSTSKDTKNVYWTAVETEGPLDLDAVTLAASPHVGRIPQSHKYGCGGQTGDSVAPDETASPGSVRSNSRR